MEHLSQLIHLDFDNKFLIDFHNEIEKISKMPFSFLNSIDNANLEYSKEIEKVLFESQICYFTDYKEKGYLKNNKYDNSERDFNINPIAQYESLQFYRFNHILLEISTDLNDYTNNVLFKISFQITHELKIKKLQKEINKILKNIEKQDDAIAFHLIYSKKQRYNYFVNSYIDIIKEYVTNIESKTIEKYKMNDTDVFKVLLYYVSNKIEHDNHPLEKLDEKWMNFELNHFKLLMLRRLENSLSLMDDFFQNIKIKLDNPVSLSLEDTSFFNKLSLILKDAKDRKFISVILRNQDFSRSKAFFDNFYNYLNNKGNSSSRFTTVGSSTYVKMVKDSYKHITNYSLSSNGLNDKWLNAFKALDKK